MYYARLEYLLTFSQPMVEVRMKSFNFLWHDTVVSSINKVILVQVFPCSDNGPIRDNPCWTPRENSLGSLELIELAV